MAVKHAHVSVVADAVPPGDLVQPSDWNANHTTEGAFEFVIDGGGAAITTGVKGDLEMPFAGTISGVTMLADQSGSIVVDLWKDTYGNFPPTDADTITSATPPTITAATKSVNTTLTGWTKTFAKGDIVRLNVDSCATIQRVTLSVSYTEG